MTAVTSKGEAVRTNTPNTGMYLICLCSAGVSTVTATKDLMLNE